MAAADYTPLYETEGTDHKLDPRILQAIGMVESNQNPNARSPAGATGVMQLMPATAKAFGVTNPLDPAQNIHGGAAALAEDLTRYKGNLGLALGAYNGGPKAIDSNRIRPETAGYVTKVLDRFAGLGGTVPPGTTIPKATLPDHAAVKNGRPLTPSDAVTGFHPSDYEALQKEAFKDPLVGMADKAVSKEIEANDRAASVVEKNIPEYAKLRERMRAAGQLPDAPNFQELPGEKQVEIRDPLKALTQFMPILALLGGAVNKNFSLAAMDAATGAMNAQKAGDYAKREEEHQKWLDNTKRVVEGNALMLNRYEIAMGRRKAGLDEIKGEMEAIASENGDLVTLANLQKGNLESVYKGMQIHKEALDPIAKIYAASLTQAAKAKLYTTSKGIPVNYTNGMLTVTDGINPDGTPHVRAFNQETDGDLQTVSPRPRNTGMLLLQDARNQWAKNHGGAEMPVEQEKEFLINFSAQSKAMAKFTSGKWQENLIAANTALQHLDVLSQAAANLNTGDVQAVNGFVQAVATEFGRPEAVDFNSAKDVVADELVKAVIGTGGGVTDRDKAQQAFKSINSPAQMAGVINVQKGLLAGRLDSLHRAYVETAKGTDFPVFLSPLAAQTMRDHGFDPAAEPQTGQTPPAAAPAKGKPAGAPADAKQAPDGNWYSKNTGPDAKTHPYLRW